MKKIISIIIFIVIAVSVVAQSGEKAKIKHLNANTFRKKIFDYKKYKTWQYKGKTPLLIDFYANWCAPCRQVAPILEQLQKEYGNELQIYKVDITKETELAKVFGIREIPAFLFVPIGGKPQMAKGALSKSTFIKAINELLHLKPKNTVVTANKGFFFF